MDITIQVKSDSGSKYTIELKDDGSFWCSCPAMKFQRQKPAAERTCKHIDAATHAMALQYAKTHPQLELG